MTTPSTTPQIIMSYYADSIAEEAASLVESWLNGANKVDTFTDDNFGGNPISYLSDHALLFEDGSRDAGPTSDYVTKVQWDTGQVVDNVRIVLDGLMDTKINVPDEPTEWKGYDPLIKMEMRHQQVRQRRKERDHAHSLALREEQRKENIRLKAHQLIMKEREENKAKMKREEEEIKRHVIALRKQVKEQKERERALKGLLDKEKKEREKERECKEINAEMNKIKESRKNKMKMVLMEQLDEIEAKELKTNLKMMRQCFNVWRDHIERENATAIKRGKAIEKWRLTSRCWKAWKGVVNESHAHRLAEKDLERLRSERKLMSKADSHYKIHLLMKCLIAWRGVVSLTRLHFQSTHCECHVSTFLELIASKRKEEEKKSTQSLPSQALPLPSPPQRRPMKETSVQTDQRSNKDGRGSSKGVWSTARSHVDTLLDTLLAEGAKRAAATEAVSPFRGETHSSEVTSINRQDKPIVRSTKPLSLKKMEERSALIAKRKEAREERKIKKEMEMKEKMEKEEEEKKRIERENKEAEMIKRRKEKRIALEKEKERMLRAELLAKLAHKANDHYRKRIMASFGINPWRRFIIGQRERQNMADRFRDNHTMRLIYELWKRKMTDILQVKTDAADKFRRGRILVNTFNGWKEYISYQHELMGRAERMRGVLLLGKMMRGWHRLAREECIKTWEKERRARKHHEKHMMVKCMKSWRVYVPLSMEEKNKELRRDKLRDKVRLWLPDYNPSS